MVLLLTNIRKRKRLVLLPVLGSGIFVPLMCWYYCVHFTDTPDEIIKNTLILMHTCIPMLVTWWIILLYHDFFSWEGNELLYYYHSQRALVKQYVIVLLVYGLMETAVFAVVQSMVDMPYFILGQLLAETMCVAAMVYFFAFLLLNTGGCLLVSIGYCVYINMFDTLNLFGFMSIFPRPEEFLVWNGGRVRNTLVAAAVLHAVGLVCMKFRRRYK